MAFTFPSRDDRSLPYSSSNPSSYTCFTQQAIWVGYAIPGDGRQAEIQRYSNDVRESVEREIEKQRIRAQIIAEEVSRRRILEEEVRRELMLGREMALQRLDSSSGIAPFVQESSIVPYSFGHFEERRLELLPTMPSHLEFRFQGFGSPPFQRHPVAAISPGLGFRDAYPPPEPREEAIALNQFEREKKRREYERLWEESKFQSTRGRQSEGRKRARRQSLGICEPFSDQFSRIGRGLH